MNIFFCDACAARVTDADLRSGHGLRRRHQVLCAACIATGTSFDAPQQTRPAAGDAAVGPDLGREEITARVPAGRSPQLAEAIGGFSALAPAAKAAPAAPAATSDDTDDLDERPASGPVSDESVAATALTQPAPRTDPVDSKAEKGSAAAARVHTEANRETDEMPIAQAPAAPKPASGSVKAASKPANARTADAKVAPTVKSLPAVTAASAASAHAHEPDQKAITEVNEAINDPEPAKGGKPRPPQRGVTSSRLPKPGASKAGRGAVPAASGKNGSARTATSGSRPVRRRLKKSDQQMLMVSGISVALILIIGVSVYAYRNSGSGRTTTPFDVQPDFRGPLNSAVSAARDAANGAIGSGDLGKISAAMAKLEELSRAMNEFERRAKSNDPPWNDDQIFQSLRSSGASDALSLRMTLNQEKAKVMAGSKSPGPRP